MSDHTQKNRETAAKLGVVGFFTAALGPIGFLAAAFAVMVQQACFPNVGEDSEARAMRKHEDALDRSAKRAAARRRHEQWLAAIDAEQQRYRQARRDWWANGAHEADRPQPYVIAPDGQPVVDADGKPVVTRGGRLRQALRTAWARTALFGGRAATGWRRGYRESKELRAERKPHVAPFYAGLAAAAKAALFPSKVAASPQAPDPAARPAEATPPAEQSAPSERPTKPAEATPPAEQASDAAQPSEQAPEQKPSVEEGSAAEPEKPGTAEEAKPTQDGGADETPAPARNQDPELDSAVSWFANGGDASTTATQTAGEHAGPENDSKGDTTMTDTENNTPAAPATQGEANVELVDADLAEAQGLVTQLEAKLAEINAIRGELKAKVEAARARGEVEGAQAQVLAALEGFDALVAQLGESIDTASERVVDAADNGNAARRSLEPTLGALDALRVDGGRGDMAATATRD